MPVPNRLLWFLWLWLFALAVFASPLERLQQRAAESPLKSGLHLLEKGESSLLARAWLTDHARESIDVQYFIWSTDVVGTLSSEALLRAAERGVRVRVIVDDLLIDAEPETLLSLAAHPNVFIRIYNPVHSVGVSFWERLWHLATDFRGANQRMHDKLAIFDRRLAITGGRNMADEYYDHDQAYNFRDRDLLVAGAVVQEMDRSFNRFWNSPLSVQIEQLLEEERQALTPESIAEYRSWLHDYARHPENFAPEVRSALLAMDSRFPAMLESMRWSRARFIADRPGKNESRQGLEGGGLSSTLLAELVANARASVTIQSPYLVMPEGGLPIFRKLIERGVKVRVVTNSLASTDNLQAFSGYYNQREALLAAGLEIYEYRPDPAVGRELIDRYERSEENRPVFALHAKSMVVDGEQLFVGTFNMDPRSVNLNTEVGVLVADRELAGQVETAIEREMLPENSWRAGQDDPDSHAGLWKRIKVWFWSLLPLEPLL